MDFTRSYPKHVPTKQNVHNFKMNRLRTHSMQTFFGYIYLLLNHVRNNKVKHMNSDKSGW